MTTATTRQTPPKSLRKSKGRAVERAETVGIEGREEAGSALKKENNRQKLQQFHIGMTARDTLNNQVGTIVYISRTGTITIELPDGETLSNSAKLFEIFGDDATARIKLPPGVRPLNVEIFHRLLSNAYLSVENAIAGPHIEGGMRELYMISNGKLVPECRDMSECDVKDLINSLDDLECTAESFIGFAATIRARKEWEHANRGMWLEKRGVGYESPQ